MKKLILGGVLLALMATNANAAERLDGCNPSAPENQSITGAVWKSKCLNAKVHAVWLTEYNDPSGSQENFCKKWGLETI